MSIEQINQIIGQLEASIDKIESFLDIETFADYCDSTYTAIAHWKILQKKIKDESKSETN